MRSSNEMMDRIVKIARMKNLAKRRSALDELDAETRKLRDEHRVLGQHVGWLFSSRGATDWFKVNFAGRLVALVSMNLENADRNRTRYELTLLGLGLAAYRADHGEYPKTLAELTPKYARRIPNDLYSEQPLIYKRTSRNFLLYSIGENGVDDGGHRYDGHEHEGPPDKEDDDLAIRVPPWPTSK